jgi:site-specific DNA recombinase
MPTNTNPKRACALVRVSSEEQVNGGYGLEFQDRDIRTFCERNNLELLKVFRDEGYSGATADRPGFKEMMEWAREKRFEVLVVWKLDRLFRDTRLTLQTIDELASLGIEFRSVQETFTHDSNGRFLLTIFAAGAEKERKDIAMRMSAGRIAAAKRGAWIGPVNAPFGYRYNRETKKLEIDEDEASVVKNMFRWLVDEKLSLYKIQCRLNELRVPTRYDRIGRPKQTGSTCWWRIRTIGRILTNEVHTGSYTSRKYKKGNRVQTQSNLRPQDDWIIITTPAIVSKEIFRRALEQLRENSLKSPRRTKWPFLLGKLLICGHDGRRMLAYRRLHAASEETRNYYFCPATEKSYVPVRCRSSTVNEARIGPPVWNTMKQLLTDPRLALQQLSEYRNRKDQKSEFAEKRRALEAQKGKVSRRAERLTELYLGEAVDKAFFQQEHRRLKDEAERIGREMRKLEGLFDAREKMAMMARTLEDLAAVYKDKLESATYETKREVLNTFVKNVVVRNDDLEIEVALPAPDAFAGQGLPPPPRKDTISVFLRARLLPWLLPGFKEKKAKGVDATREHGEETYSVGIS